MAVGIAAGYYIISGILSAFARKPEQGKGTPVMAAQGVSGD